MYLKLQWLNKSSEEYMRKDCDDFSSIKHRMDSQPKKKKKSSIEFKLSTIYPRVIWTKFKLPTYGLKLTYSPEVSSVRFL